MKYIPYGKQFIDNNDKKFVINALSNDLITTGPFIKKFENKLKKYLKCNYSYVCSSGTASLHLSMLSLELKKGDIILMPAINFVASYNMAKTMNLKVYLVDVDENTGQITPEKILDCIRRNKLKKIKALITMYHGGYPENVKKIYDIKKKYNFFIIEDACHALGSEYQYKNIFYKVGSCKHADISTFSLHPLKTITSGEGGIITTNSKKISKNIELYRNHGILRDKNKHWKYDILRHGFNYRISDINCALGLSQLTKINIFIKNRNKIYEKYVRELKNFDKNLLIPKYSLNIKPSFHLFLVNIQFNKLKKKKDNLMKYFLKNKILTQQHYIPIYKFKIFDDIAKSYPGSEKYIKNSISIPIFASLSVNNQNKVIKIIKKFIKSNK